MKRFTPWWPAILSIGLVFAALTVIHLVMSSAEPIDLSVYRKGGEAVLTGDDLLYPKHYEGLPFTYTPFAALAFVPFALVGSVATTILVTLLSLIALYLASLRWWQTLAPDGVLWRNRMVTPLAAAAALLPLAVAAEPVSETLSFGQVNLLLCAAIVADALAPASARWRGIGVGIATGFKLTPGIFLLWFALTKQWRAFFTGCVSCAATIAVGFIALPRSSWSYWTEVIFNAERVGGLAYASNQSLNGMIWRLVGEGGSSPLWLVAVAGVSALAALAIVLLWRTHHVMPSLLVAAFWGLLVSPVSWSHHWVWVWLLGLTLVALLRQARSTPNIWLHLWRGSGWALLGCWAFAAYSRTVWWFPHDGDREYIQPVIGKILTDAYGLLALATLVWWAWAGVLARRSRLEALDLAGSSATMLPQRQPRHHQQTHRQRADEHQDAI